MGNKTLWVIAALTVLIDQALKFLLDGVHQILIPGVLALNSTRNMGMALGLLPGSALTALFLSSLVLVLLFLLLKRARVMGLASIGLGLLIGGAIGNLIDRALFLQVRDMFEFLFVDFYVFNFADVGVVLGTALTAISLLFREKEWIKK